MANRPGTFKKNDPRINRKGRPKSFDAVRELARAIAHEEARSKGAPVVINNKKATVIEMILRKWSTSNNPSLVKAFVEIAFGKTPEIHELTSTLTIVSWDDANGNSKD